ncbi:cmbl [Scenedesmus sp. PABB004]|nr:cmbl [Scenedesmus sp. PABB004]
MMHRLALVFVALAALASAAPAPAAPARTLDVKAFAEGHSGPAAGTVTLTGKGAGSERKIGGYDAYVAAPPGGAKPAAAVLLVTDVFGWKADNARVWADQLAKKGFLVVMPDYFKGGARTKADAPATFKTWLAKFPRERILSETDAVLADVRKQYPSVKKLGVQGFCWGGLYAVLLTHKPARVAAAVVYHGSLLTPADIEAIAAPISFQQADPTLDSQIKTEFFAAIRASLARKAAAGGLDASATAFAGMPHGFAMRANASDPATTAAATTAFNAGAAFLAKHLLA